MTRIYIYSRFNRFWHWSQALLVILLAWTGFEIHFSPIGLLGFERAVVWHRWLAWAFLILIAFAIFWHVTTGQWRQYIPTSRFLLTMVRFYLLGIFRNAPHPVHKTQLSKLNPLQRLTYLGLKILVIPVLATSGLLYYYYNEWGQIGLQELKLAPVALVHTFAAYVLMAFMFVHVYLTTTGRTPLANLKAMLTGWEEVDEEGAHAEATPTATNPPTA
jgi:thiosulfate reductase cytochrome b subunit